MMLVQPTIRFVGLEVHERGGGVDVRFEIRDERDDVVGHIITEVPPTQYGTMDSLIARAHRQMAAVAKAWAGRLEDMAAAYEQ